MGVAAARDAGERHDAGFVSFGARAEGARGAAEAIEKDTGIGIAGDEAGGPVLRVGGSLQRDAAGRVDGAAGGEDAVREGDGRADYCDVESGVHFAVTRRREEVRDGAGSVACGGDDG